MCKSARAAFRVKYIREFLGFSFALACLVYGIKVFSWEDRPCLVLPVYDRLRFSDGKIIIIVAYRSFEKINI